MEFLDFYILLRKEIKDGQFYPEEPLQKYTTWRVGGPADLLYRPKDSLECAKVLQLAREFDVPVTILGVGSNVLIADQGLRGLVILTDGFSDLSWRDHQVVAGSGVLLSHLSRLVADRGLSGLEFAAGIPGSLGGAVVMNAGAYGLSMEQLIVSVKALDMEGKIQEYAQEDLAWDYRYSIFKQKKELIFQVKLALQPGEIPEIKEQMHKYLQARREKQPLELPNAGSVFKNTGQGAGRLIESIGAKGWRMGNAQVSEKHANFIVNLGEAKATEIRNLIREVQRAVKERCGVELETEVVFLGFEDNRR